MPVSDRLRRKPGGSDETDVSKTPLLDITAHDNFFLLDRARHFRNRLLAEQNLKEIAELPPKVLRARIEALVSNMMREEGTDLSPVERASLITFLVNETVGRGPLERLSSDPTITEIMVNGPDQVYIERNGKLIHRPDVRFQDHEHILHVIDRIVSPLGRRIDESSPMVDARTREGERVNAVIKPISISGPILTIRRFGREPFTMEKLIQVGTLSEEMAEFLKACVIAKQNILVSGGTGSGKTTTLNVLASFIPKDERIITIEDAAELQFYLVHPHVVRMETRLPNIEGKGEIKMRQLVRNALRMRPNRIIVGEVRGEEALDMLQAMNTGHEGSLTTLHANSAQDALARLETMVRWAEGASNLPQDALREHLVSAVNIVIQQDRISDGTRKIVSISEIQGVKRGKIVLKDIFVFEPHGTDAKTKSVLGLFTPTGVRPRCLNQMRIANIHLDPNIFQPAHLVAEVGPEMLESGEVTEIMVNGPDEVFIERQGQGKLERSDIKFRDETHLMSVINRIVTQVGRHVDETTPYVDARLPNGSRVNVILPPLALNGPVVTIRMFPKVPLTIEELLVNGTFTSEMIQFLESAVRSKLNILICGGSGSGKTTTLNILSSFIPPHERIITIEDVAELQLRQSHVIRLETRPADEYKEGEVTTRDLVRNALRMRPDRIIVGEVRGPEALDMLQAMNTGHEGSLSTIHANSPEDAFSRLETMVMWAGVQLPSSVIREQLVGAINIVVQQNRLIDGKRRITAISEIYSVSKDGQIDLKDIYVFKQVGIQADQKVIGHFEATGVIPRALERFRQFGITISPDKFTARQLSQSNVSNS